MALLVALKQGPHGLLLVITDKNLLGRRIEEGNLQLDLRSQFYQGEEKSKAEIENLMEKARDIMFTGKEAVALGIEADLVDIKKILYIKRVPYAQAAFG